MSVQSRLVRYAEFIENEYLAGFRKPDEYSLENLSPDLRRRIRNGEFTRIVFTGMGCSAIVSDVIRGYFVEQRVPIDVHVMNDYDSRFLIPDSILHDEGTLIVISSYSGHSTEPLMALQQLSSISHRVLLLTSGGKLAERGRETDISIAYWRLRNPDREYPLFHVTQYFAILMDVFFQLGVVDHDHRADLVELTHQLRRDFDETRAATARRIAEESVDANLVMIASPKWHESLLKLCKMHLNEIAMVPATRNYLHEFCHSEVASLSNTKQRHSLLVFVDSDDDDYTKHKAANLVRLLTADRWENRNVVVNRVELDQPGFLRKFFGALNLVQHITLELGRYENTASRELISEAAGNSWYHRSTMAAERELRDSLTKSA
jgi:glucose/mannose-6-phosphate isomerase